MPHFGLTILGNNSALPAFDRHPTSQALYFDNQIFLIDCGEGTQMQIARYKIKPGRINYIFISHLHGDHYFGLIGLITSMSLLGRETSLHIYGPDKLKNIIEMQLGAAGNHLNFPLIFHANSADGLILEEEKFSVSCFAVKHRVECWGYIFREKKMPRKIDRDKAVAANIPAAFYKRLQAGEDYTRRDGVVIKNETVTQPNNKGRSYAYCADTIFDPALSEIVTGADLLYHETTYLKDLEERAASRYHSTTIQAAAIAKAAAVKRLIIGHFSSKYEELDCFLEEAGAVFANTSLALEGITFRITAPEK